jgi:hypothetical protein
MSKPRLIAVLMCTALLAASVVSPALGGPSLGSVAKTAKKALKTANKANSRALSAQEDAGDALDRADDAMQRGQITVVTSAPVGYGPTDIVQTAIAYCPAGQRAVGGGGANIGDEELAASVATVNRSGWGVIGVDLVDNGGEYVQAQALCAPSGQAVAANRSAARAQMSRLARRIEATASKSCSSGYTHAVMPDGSHKCLRAGQFCSRKRAWQRVYHRKGFHCGANRHLTYY